MSVLILVCSISVTGLEYHNRESIDDIVSTFKYGSSRDLARFFDNGIDINISGIQGDYSKNQAEQVMRDFFKKFPPSDFTIVHKGNGTDLIINYIGNYKSDNSEFRVFIKGKKNDENIRIYSLDIVKA
ncbi:DUF4783 domain-containing protein [Indibacter alkaliphilus]|uniref:DUF4783 domain-containing protein n=1 Tax=Indibacter alkaliphilus TaxID=579922 RepID=UPI001F1F7979|nr:DUF4783 domain-containing protein [Indibacter alkaliphilus]